MDGLDVGSIVSANLSIGRHPAIVLSTKEEIEADGMVRVVAISGNDTIAIDEDRIEVPLRGLGIKKKCFVQCCIRETLRIDQVKPNGRKAWGPFLEQVLKQVKVAAENGR